MKKNVMKVYTKIFLNVLVYILTIFLSLLSVASTVTINIFI